MLEYFFPHFYGKFSKNIEVCNLIKIISNCWYDHYNHYLLIPHSYNSQLKLLSCIFKRGQKAGAGQTLDFGPPKNQKLFKEVAECNEKNWPGVPTPVYILGGCRCTDFQDNGAVQPLDYGPPKEPRVVQGSYRMY